MSGVPLNGQKIVMAIPAIGGWRADSILHCVVPVEADDVTVVPVVDVVAVVEAVVELTVVIDPVETVTEAVVPVPPVPPVLLLLPQPTAMPTPDKEARVTPMMITLERMMKPPRSSVARGAAAKQTTLFANGCQRRMATALARPFARPSQLKKERASRTMRSRGDQAHSRGAKPSPELHLVVTMRCSLGVDEPASKIAVVHVFHRDDRARAVTAFSGPDEGLRSLHPIRAARAKTLVAGSLGVIPPALEVDGMNSRLMPLSILGGVLFIAGAGACGSDPPPPAQPPPPTATVPPPQPVEEGDAILDCSMEPVEHLCRIKIAKTIYYDTDKDLIRPESFAVLNAVAHVIQTHPEIKQCIVEGHTDNQGTIEHNRDLSERRSGAVVRYLTSVGISLPMQSPGYGATVPVCNTEDDVCKQMNRRVEFKVKRE